MPWTDERWAMFVSILQRGFAAKEPFTNEDSDVYRLLLDGVEPEAAIGAVREMVLAGAALRPKPGEIVARVKRDPSTPTFAEAYRLMFDPGGAATDNPREGIHPLVTSFVARHGSWRLRMLPLNDPEWGEKHRRDLERDWYAHLSAMEGRETAALAAGGDVRRLDPLGMAGLRPELPGEAA